MSEGEAWWEFLSQGQRDLVKQSYDLLEKFEARSTKSETERFHDYSFAVFSIFPKHQQFISVEEAEMKLGQLREAMRVAVECAR